MSLILEALRKSEAERHQESLPESLAKHQALLYATNRRAYYWPVLICLLLLINLGVLGYFAYQAVYKSPSVFSASTEITESSNSIKSTTRKPDLLPKPIDSDRDLPTSATQEASLSAVRAALAGKLPAQSHASTHNPSQFRHTDQNKTDLERYTPANKSRVPAQPEFIAPSQQQRNQQLLNDKNSRPNTENSANIDAKLTKTTSTDAKTNLAIPHINELDKIFLATLPRLVFSSHIYSKESSGRRIMINDNYLREGEGFLGIKVIEITEDGVVLEKQTQQFRVPVVRDWSPAG